MNPHDIGYGMVLAVWLGGAAVLAAGLIWIGIRHGWSDDDYAALVPLALGWPMAPPVVVICGPVAGLGLLRERRSGG